MDASVLTYPRERVNDVLGTPDGVAGKDLTVRAFGANLDTLRASAADVRDAVAEVDGVESARVQVPIVEPTIEVEVDLEQAQELGISPGDVRRSAATLVQGIIVGNLFEEQKIFEVTVQGTEDLSASVDNIRNLLVDRPEGGQVPLESVADVRIAPSPNVIKHEDVSRYIDIGVDVSGRDRDAVASDIEDVLRNDLNFPLEYHAEVVDGYQDEQSDRLFFIGLAIAALIGIFLILQSALSSWRMATVLFVALLGALTGGLIAALIDGELITIGSLVGFLAVYGLAARTSILFVKRCHAFEDREGATFGPELVRRAAAERFAATVTTAVAVVLVFLPLVFWGGAGLEVVQPMAVVVLGGVVTATLLNLFVVPALYLRFGSRPEGARDQFDTFVDEPEDEVGGEVPQAPSLVDA